MEVGSSTQVEVEVISPERQHLALHQSPRLLSYLPREHQSLSTAPDTTPPRVDFAVQGTQVVFPWLEEVTDTRPCPIHQWLSTI